MHSMTESYLPTLETTAHIEVVSTHLKRLIYTVVLPSNHLSIKPVRVAGQFQGECKQMMIVIVSYQGRYEESFR